MKSPSYIARLNKLSTFFFKREELLQGLGSVLRQNSRKLVAGRLWLAGDLGRGGEARLDEPGERREVRKWRRLT